MHNFSAQRPHVWNHALFAPFREIGMMASAVDSSHVSRVCNRKPLFNSDSEFESESDALGCSSSEEDDDSLIASSTESDDSESEDDTDVARERCNVFMLKT